jgi:predicted nucleic acid-binding protein
VKVILDANVLVSAAIATGPSYRLVARWLDQRDLDLEVVICPALLAEVEDVLDRPRLRKRVDPELEGVTTTPSTGRNRDHTKAKIFSEQRHA